MSLGDISQVVDNFIDVFDQLKKTGQAIMPTQPETKPTEPGTKPKRPEDVPQRPLLPPEFYTPVTEPDGEKYVTPYERPLVPREPFQQPTTITPMPTQMPRDTKIFDKFIDAISPLKVEIIKPISLVKSKRGGKMRKYVTPLISEQRAASGDNKTPIVTTIPTPTAQETKPSTIVLPVSDPKMLPAPTIPSTQSQMTVYTIDKTPADPNAEKYRQQDRALWEKWQWIGLVVAVSIPLFTVLLNWLINKKRSKKRR